MNKLQLHLRPMQNDDVEEVMAVERLAYEFPWTIGNMRDCLKSSYCCWVYLQDERIIGYAVMSVAAGEANILNLCIHPDMQGRGLGRKLMEQMLMLAHQQQADTVFLELRVSNRVASGLYDAVGFNEMGVRRNYYPAKKGREDAILMAKVL
ncbi:ribosomal protein S18-alanine N-acetyltransferase [Pseudomonadota bacterium]